MTNRIIYFFNQNNESFIEEKPLFPKNLRNFAGNDVIRTEK